MADSPTRQCARFSCGQRPSMRSHSAAEFARPPQREKRRAVREAGRTLGCGRRSYQYAELVTCIRGVKGARTAKRGEIGAELEIGRLEDHVAKGERGERGGKIRECTIDAGVGLHALALLLIATRQVLRHPRHRAKSKRATHRRTDYGFYRCVVAAATSPQRDIMSAQGTWSMLCGEVNTRDSSSIRTIEP